MSITRVIFVVALLLVSLQARSGMAADSGFIDHMPQLAPDANRAGAMIWTKPGIDPAAYKKIMIEPIMIFINQDSEYKGLNASDLKALADGFNETLVKTLGPEITVMDKAGPGVVYLRAALTNVKLAKKSRGLLGYTPVGLVVTAAKDLAGARISLTDAVLEVEMIDSVSGERIGVLVDKAPKDASAENLSWEAIDKTFVFYTSRLKSRMLAK